MTSEARSAGRGRGSAGSLILVLVCVLAFGWLHARELEALPRVLPPSWSADARHIRQADVLAAGQGFAPYDHETLRDRPGYAIFLARVGSSGRPAFILADLLAAALMGLFLLRLGLDPLLAVGAFALALFTPALLGEIGQQLAPELLHARLVVVAAALALQAAITRRPLPRLLLFAIAGFFVALAAITAAEWPRILPLLAAAAAAGFLLDRRGGATAGCAAGRVLLAAILIAVPVWTATGRIIDLDEERYGLALLSDEDEPDFNAALGALQRIARASESGRLDRALRARLYEASPAFASLRAVVESDLYSGPTGPEDDGGRPAALLRRTVREAVTRQGLYASPATAREFYRRLAAELDQAVDGGRVVGLAERLATDRPAFPLAALGLFWLRLGELWSLEFEDLAPGERLPRLELDPADLEAARRVLAPEPLPRPGGDREGPDLDRAARAREGRLMLYRRILPGLFLLAAVGLLMRVLGARREGIDRRLLGELVLVAGLAAILLALCAEEKAWLIDRGRGFIALHLLAPFWLALGLDHHLAAVAPTLAASTRRRWRLVLAGLLAVGLVLVVVLPSSAAERDRRPVRAEDNFFLTTAGVAATADGSVVLADEDARIELRLREDGGGPGARKLVLEMAMPGAARGSSITIEWEGPARDERGGRERQLFRKSAEEGQRWEIAIQGRRVGDVTIRSPEQPGLLVRPVDLRIEALERRFAAGPDPLPEVRARRLAPDRVAIEVRGGERESRYEFFCSGGVSTSARIYPEREGELWLEDALGLHGDDGDDLRLDVLTDAEGNGSAVATIRCREPLPERLFIQGLGTQHFTAAPIECVKAY